MDQITPQQPSDTEAAFTSLDGELDRLLGSIHRLESTLAPVLKESKQLKACPSNPRNPGSTILVSLINDISDKLQVGSYLVENLIERVDLPSSKPPISFTSSIPTPMGVPPRR